MRKESLADCPCCACNVWLAPQLLQAQPHCTPTKPPHLDCSQGLNQLMWCLPTGGFDPRRHTSYEACARAEVRRPDPGLLEAS